jgi:hypothetical protein
MNWQALDLAASEYDQPPRPPDIGGLLYGGKRHGISGPPESMKTIVAWILALEHLRARNTVAVVDFEMGPYATRLLLLDLGFTLDEIRERVVYYDSPGAPDAARGGSAVVKVRVHKDRGGHLTRPVAVELHLHSDPEIHLLKWEWTLPASASMSNGAWRPTIYMERVSRHFEEHGPKSRTATYRDVSAKRERVIDATNFLLYDGYLDEGWNLVSVRPFRNPVPGGSRSIPNAERNPDTAGSPVPKPFPLVPGTGSPGGSRGSPAYRREPGTGNRTARSAPLLAGDAGYLHGLSLAKENGHVTQGEWERLKLVHQGLARRATWSEDNNAADGRQKGARS